MESKQRVTITEVAQSAQVSVSTVSNVLTGNRPVAAKTRSRVLQIATEMGYQPNRLARGLVSRSSNTIGVVVSGLEYYGPSQTLVGIEAEASERGYTLILSLIHEPASEDVRAVVDNLLSHQVDGIIWAVPEIGRNHDWGKRSPDAIAVPIVFLDTQPATNLATAGVDNFYGGYCATRHLLENGFERIGIITGPPDWLAARERQRGWAQALEEAGKNVTPAQIAAGDWKPQSGERAFYRLMKSFPTMDALFAGNDQMAMGVLRAARELKIRIPQEIALVGYDDIPESDFTDPRLTTVHQHTRKVGRAAVAALVDTLTRSVDSAALPTSTAPRSILLKPELVVRESSGRRHGRKQVC